MTKHLLSSVAGATSLLLVSALNSSACGTGTSTIMGLFDAAGDTFQVAALSSGGQITGYFYGAGQPLGFLDSNGVLTDLGTLGGGYSQGIAVNGSGQVAGGSLLPDYSFHAFLYSGGQLADLGTLGGNYSNPAFINDNGEVVGISSLASGDTVAFLYTNGPLVSLGTLGETYSSAFGVNNNGVICGESSVASGDVHGFVYSPGTGMTDVGTLGGTYSSCSALNANGTAIGDSSLADGSTHAFSYSGGPITDLGTLGGSSSSAAGINNAGQVVGSATTLNDQQTHGFVFTGGAMVDIGSLGGGYSSAFAINNVGQVVGESATATGGTHAFIWQNGTLADLNSQLPAGSGWELFSARFLNDSGRIVGFGAHNGAFEWFVMDLGSSNQPPVANAGPDQTVACQASVTLDGSHSTDPDGDALTFEWSTSGTILGTQAILTATFPLGTNVITLKVTDACGASTQTNVSVIVVDTPPTITCPADITAATDANCQAAVPNVVSQVIASGSCPQAGFLLITQNPAAGTLVGLGAHPVAVTATDASGNSSQCSMMFTVVDLLPPVIVSAPGPIALSADGNCQATVPNVVSKVVATDNCTPANLLVMTQNPAPGTLIGVGPSTIAVTVTDASGNSSLASISLKVSDTTAPTILATPGPITVAASANCQASVPNVVPNVVATDNCTAANQLVITQNPAAGTVLPLGQYVIAITATDTAGNSASAGVSLAIADTTPPVIVSAAGPIALSADGNCQATVPNLVSNVVATDNCTPSNQLVITQNPAAGTLIGVGPSTIAVTVTDASGNSSVTNVSLKVSDTAAPTILATPGPITVSATANCQASVPNVVPNVVATDNCTPANQLVIKQNPAAGTLLPLGHYVITIIVTDAVGNSTTAGVSLTVANTTAPVIQALTVSPSILSPPNHQLVPVIVSAVVSDGCDSAPVSKIINITCSEPTAPGDIQITGNLTATLAASKDNYGTSRIYTIIVQSSDASGNTSTGTVTVTVPKSSGTSSITPSVVSHQK